MCWHPAGGAHALPRHLAAVPLVLLLLKKEWNGYQIRRPESRRITGTPPPAPQGRTGAQGHRGGAGAEPLRHPIDRLVGHHSHLTPITTEIKYNPKGCFETIIIQIYQVAFTVWNFKTILVTKLWIVGFKRKPERPESPTDNKPRPSEGSESGRLWLLALQTFSSFNYLDSLISKRKIAAVHLAVLTSFIFSSEEA